MPNQDFLKQDFSAEGNKEKIKQMAIRNSSRKYQAKEIKDMKHSYRRFTAAAIVVICLAGAGFSMTTYGQSLFTVIKEVIIGSGHATYVQEEYNIEPNYEIPDYLKGQLFDAGGNEMTKFPQDGMFYSKTGEQIFLSGDDVDNLKIISADEVQSDLSGEYALIPTLEETASYLAFTPLAPSYLPDGYAVKEFMLFKGDDGVPESGSKYLQFYITNGNKNKDIYVQLRLMDEETAYAASIDEFEEIEVKGYPGISSDGGKNIDFEMDGVMVMISAKKSGLPANEIVKLAESFVK